MQALFFLFPSALGRVLDQSLGKGSMVAKSILSSIGVKELLREGTVEVP